MNDTERQEAAAIDQWCRNYMAEHNCDYVAAFRAVKHDMRARRYEADKQETQRQKQRQQLVAELMRDFPSMSRLEIEQSIDKYAPSFKKEYGAIHDVASKIGSGTEQERIEMLTWYLDRNRDLAMAAAGEQLEAEARILVTKYAPPGFQADAFREMFRRARSEHPDLQRMYDFAEISESALRKIFWSWFRKEQTFSKSCPVHGVIKRA